MKALLAHHDEERASVAFRLEDGTWMRKPAPYSFYIRASQLTNVMRQKLRASTNIKGISVDSDSLWCRIDCLNNEVRRKLIGNWGPFADVGVKTYEGDVDPITRAMLDYEVSVARPKRVYLDIETDSRVSFANKEQMRVLAYALVDAQTGETWSEVLRTDSDLDEEALLAGLWERCLPYDQIVAWNGDDFDFYVLHARSRMRGVKYAPQRWLFLDHLKVFKRMNTAAESGDEKQSMALQNIAMSFLGEGKDDFDAKFTWQAWEAGGEQRERMVRYCAKDTLLLHKLEERTGFLELFQTLCEACGVFPDSRGLLPTRQVDAFMLRLAKGRNEHFETRPYREEAEKYLGAYVMEPKGKGIMRGVHVGDFASLYPSVMISWNISPDTKIVGEPEGLPHSHTPLTRAKFRTDRVGLLPEALKQLLALRKESNTRKASLPPGTPEWKDADRKATAYKVAANSFYGVIGSPNSRFYDKAVGEAVTQNGVYLIKQTIEAAEARNMEVVYCDTDSVFVHNTSKTQFEAFVNWCNEQLYPQLLEENGCIENRIQLAYEKEFERVVFAGKKRYAARFAHYKGKQAEANSKPEVKGFEYKRSDTALLARRLQERAIIMLMDGASDPKMFLALASEAKDRVLNGKLEPKEYVMSKGLSRPLNEYVARKSESGEAFTEPVHVRVARLMAARGEEVNVGTRIEYVITDGEDKLFALPAADLEKEGLQPDRFYLWENLVYPPLQRLLEAAFPGEDWESGFTKVRPPRSTSRYRKVNESQLGFAAFAPVERGACEVTVEREEDIERVLDLATEHPGAMRLVISTKKGARSETNSFVSGTNTFLKLVDEINLAF